MQHERGIWYGSICGSTKSKKEAIWNRAAILRGEKEIVVVEKDTILFVLTGGVKKL